VQSPLSARAALLQALVIPGYGRELIDRVADETGGLVRLEMGSVYPALEALEAQGLARGQIVRKEKGAGRPRKYYELTAKGMAVAAAEREALAGLLRIKAPPATHDAVELMRLRLRRTARISSALIKLRRRMLAQGTPS